MGHYYSGTYTSGIGLNNWGVNNPVTIGSTASIGNNNTSSNQGDGILGNTGSIWTLTNFGSVQSAFKTGIALNGTIINSGSISGYQGVAFAAVASLTNNTGGRIVATGTNGHLGGQGVDAGTGATITNSGYIIGAYGVFLSGTANLTNNAGGTIAGTGTIGPSDVAIVLHNGGTITNAGLITSLIPGGAGVHLDVGGSLVNNAGGTIAGAGGAGVDTGGSPTITNSGVITGGAFGAEMQAGGTLVNNEGGTITTTGTGGAGVWAYSTAGVITNAGVITGDNGVYLGHDGSVTNSAGGTITASSGAGIVLGGAPAFGSDLGGTVSNAGVINGNQYGIKLQSTYHHTVINSGTITGTLAVDGNEPTPGATVVNKGAIISSAGTAGTAVHFGQSPAFGATSSNLLAIYPGAMFVGNVVGNTGSGISNTIDLKAGAQAGTLSGLGTQFINFGSIAFDNGADWLIAGSTSGLGGTISGFASGDTIEITGITATGWSYASGVLTLTDTSGTATLHLPGSFTTSDFVVTNVAGGAEVSIACFRAGTRIRTARGEVPVEQLLVGDQMEALLGGTRAPIVWIGHRTVDCKNHPNPKQVWPVLIRADAFGPGLPCRDLFLSPDHAVFTDDVLIPVKHLINGKTIEQVPTDEVTYYHVELPRHDVLLAEGLPAESYLDTGDRSNFANGGGPIALHPDFSARMWEAMGCAPLVVYGLELETVRQRLNERVRHESAAMVEPISVRRSNRA